MFYGNGARARVQLTWGGKIMQNVLKYIKWVYIYMCVRIRYNIRRRVSANYFHCISTRGLSAIVCACVRVYITCTRGHIKNYIRRIMFFFVFIPFNVFFPGYRGEQKRKKCARAPNLHGRAINFNFLLFPSFR